MESFEKLAALIRAEEVGRATRVDTPFGRRLLCYADLTATGRHLHFVEDRLRRWLPFYANTHTTISSTGRIMTSLREEARQVVRRAVHAGPDDQVLFVGSGATAAINKLLGLLGLRIAEPLERAYQLSRLVPPEERPLIVVGPYEHHSNELPWLESIADVVEIGLDPAGRIDLEDLAATLARHRRRPFKLGAFSAASNVTGLLTDVRAVTRLLHAEGAYAFFDYACAGPYVPIDMHPPDPAERIDALCLSMHKFIGGPQASGVLVAHRELFRSRVPERPGGGTVDYVGACHRGAVDYVERLDEREEGGTPAILGDVRVGAALVIQERIGPARIREHEVAIARRALARLSRHQRIQLLGPPDLERLAILSFNITHLHHDLVSALLDHLFGIQNRAGCSCAGPYGHRLLGIDAERSNRYRHQVARGLLGLKPGWVRVSLPYYASPEDLDFILDAVEFVAEHGRDFVPAYRLDWRDGVWRPLEYAVPCTPSLTAAFEVFGAPDACAVPAAEPPLDDAAIAAERASYFAEAQALAAELARRWQREPPLWNRPTGHPDVDELVWFDYVHTEGL